MKKFIKYLFKRKKEIRSKEYLIDNVAFGFLR